MKVPLPYVFLYLSHTRLCSWAAFCEEMGIETLPIPLSEEMDLLMDTYWSWDRKRVHGD